MRFPSYLPNPRNLPTAAVLHAASVILALTLCGCQAEHTPAPNCTNLQSWTFYGGDWNSDGTMLEATRNGRGDMAISRRDDYGSFDFSVQMQMHDLYLGTNYGDAGVLFRVSNPHIGVDSYTGYYAGLRASDHALFFGRVDGEWTQLLYAPLPAALTPGAWYTLSVRARRCSFVVTAAPAAGGASTTLHYVDPHCPATGSIGVRVYYAKAAWRNLKLTAR